MIRSQTSESTNPPRSGSIFSKMSQRLRHKSRSGAKSKSLYNTAMREDGLLPGTMIATEQGWTAVEDIVPGDRVLTFDFGPQEVLENRTLVLDMKSIPEHKAYVMHVPKGAIGNAFETRLMPMQEVLIESDRAEAEYGDPFVLMPSLLLDGYNGISKTPISGQLSLSLLLFKGQQVIQLNGGALAFAHTHACFSPWPSENPTPREVYVRLSPQRLIELIDWKTDQPDALSDQQSPPPPPGSGPFAGQSVEESYAAVASRLS